MKEQKVYNISTGKTETHNIMEDSDYDELYKDTIWKCNVWGYKVRATSWTITWYNDSCYSYYVYFTRENGEMSKLCMQEFNYLYKKLGKAKYSKVELDKMTFSVKDEK